MANPSTIEEARAAKGLAEVTFARIAEVAGVGITRIGAGYGVKVNLRRLPSGDVAIPTDVAGVPVRVQVIGPIKKRTR